MTRLAADIGGTFTDVVAEVDGRFHSTKILTTHGAPQQAVLAGIRTVLAEAGVAGSSVELFVHGTTLATNAIIERKGAVTALVTTDGFRDSVELAYENRFEQYDIQMERPEPLVPRHRRFGVPERLSARGDILIPLDETAVNALVPLLDREGVEVVAIGYLHSYLDPSHERRTRDLLHAARPDLWIALSSQVCPEIREYERLSTTCANAYIQPLIAGYLRALDEEIRALGLRCPLFLLQSSGGLCTLEQAIDRPVTLVESGPAGGAILAASLALRHGLDRVLSFDMGGTTAKLCLVFDGVPHTSRSFEVARVYRFLPGSGLPLRIPVIDMVEIGAGGGSIARLDKMGRVLVGPESAGSEPGPACYGQGGTRPTVTDADLTLGRISVADFAGGTLALDTEAAERALTGAIGEGLGTGADAVVAAYAVAELVDENMANAARVHGVERGRDVRSCTMIAFGGAAPLHACRLADKLGMDRVIVPVGAGVGSAIGFLAAPVSYEAVRTRYQHLRRYDGLAVAATLAELRAEAEAVVRSAAPKGHFIETVRASMRYVGQGHEVDVVVTDGGADPHLLERAFEDAYRSLYARTIPGLEVEVLSWLLTLVAEASQSLAGEAPGPAVSGGAARATRPAIDAATGQLVEHGVVARATLAAGEVVEGPALLTEAQTTTVVGAGFTATVGDAGELILQRRPTP